MSYVYPFKTVDKETKLAVWEKGAPIPEHDPNVWRKDICCDIIKYSEHANTKSEYGWEIDHKCPTSKGGGDTIDNLQPLSWKHNREKADIFPWFCPDPKSLIKAS